MSYGATMLWVPQTLIVGYPSLKALRSVTSTLKKNTWIQVCRQHSM